MAKLYTISDWYEIRYLNTGGTRNKKVYINPDDGEYYFFKESFKKGKRDYKYEFWSEIMASEIGTILGFRMLPYHIAVKEETIGCISKSMINLRQEELVEGGKLLQAFDSNFNPEDYSSRKKYTFDLILKTLNSTNKTQFLGDFIEMIVFDALIGNSDRHQENWAFITQHASQSNMSNKGKNGKSSGDNLLKSQSSSWSLKGWIKLLLGSTEFEGQILPQTTFAPIYDSGCSFCRELEDTRIFELIQNEQYRMDYVEKGKSEIHWDGKKISHFELLDQLTQINAIKKLVKNALSKLIQRYDPDAIQDTILGIDQELVIQGNPNIFPGERKELAFKIVNLRFEKLRAIYSRTNE